MMNGYNGFWTGPALGAGILGGWLSAFLVPLMLWGTFWKGWALWRAAKNDNKVWFVVILLLNTLGILDILYIFVFGKKQKSSPKKTKK
jgi:hypothetical protein